MTKGSSIRQLHLIGVLLASPAAALLGAAGCSDGGSTCTVGTNQECTCASGGQGVQTCIAGGEKWSACECTGEGEGEGEGKVSPDPSSVPDGQLAVSGQVTDRETGEPIGRALVMLEPAVGSIVTNDSGMYVFSAAVYTSMALQTLYRVTAEKMGYRQNQVQVTLQPGHNKNIDIQLQRAKPTVELVPSALQFVDADFNAAKATKQLKVTLTNWDMVGDLSYEVNIPTQHLTWVDVQPRTGTLDASPAYLDVKVDRTGKAPDTYHASFDIVLQDIREGTFTVNLTMLLTEAYQPE